MLNINQAKTTTKTKNTKKKNKPPLQPLVHKYGKGIQVII